MLKVGSKVKVIRKGRSDASKRYFGLVGKVIRLTEGDSCNLDIETGPCPGGFWLDELELIKETNVSKVNYHLLGDSVIVNYGGKTYSVRQGDVRFDQIVQAIREKRIQDLPDLVDTEKAFEAKGMVLKDGVLHMDNEALPESLSRRVLELLEKQLPIDIMVKFWQNLRANPSFNSRAMLYKFLEHNGHPLTEDGCFIAYRGVTSDFKDNHTGKFDNSVGAVCQVERTQVDDNPKNTCSSGLHVACFNYAKGFGPQLIEVKVNPKDVVAVPEDYNGTKMRVCKFEVVAVGEKELNTTVYKENEVIARLDQEKKQGRDSKGRFLPKA